MPRQRNGELRRMELHPASWFVHTGIDRERAGFKDEVLITLIKLLEGTNLLVYTKENQCG